MYDIICVFVAIFLLVMCTYKGMSIIWIAPLFASFAVLISGAGSLLAYYTQIFMVKFGEFVMMYYPMFLISAIFGKIMDSSGCAKSIAHYISAKLGREQAILAVVLSCSILTYGGISLFVVAFTVYPIAIELFKDSCTPKRFMPAAISLGSMTYTMTALPGTPAIQNAIPTKFLGTNTYAAPGISTITGVLMFILGMMWLKYQRRISKQNGEVYTAEYQEKNDDNHLKNLPSFWIAVIPILTVIVVNYIASIIVLPKMDTSFLSDAKFGSTNISTLAGNWSVITALFFATCVAISIQYKNIDIPNCLNKGTADSIEPVFSVSAIFGFGAVLSSLPGFIIMKDWILNTFGDNPLFASSILSSLFAAVSASSSGGISIALETMGHTFVEMANTSGISLEIIHRVIAVASNAGPLPHNGAVITVLAICGLTHKQAYKDIFVVAVLIPVIMCGVVIALHDMFGAF